MLPLSLSLFALAATTWYVAPTGFDGPACGAASSPCQTIQYAITNRVASGDTVAVAAGTYTENLHIGVSLSLIGEGPAGTIVDGNKQGSVAEIGRGATVKITGMTLQHGRTFGCGAGVMNAGKLTLVNSTVTANRAIGGDEAPGQGGGICNYGHLQMIACTLSDNTATETGGIYNMGVVHISRSTVSGNRTDSFGGAAESFGPMSIVNSTVANNSAIYGPGIYNVGDLAVNSSTISGNRSPVGAAGGIDNAALGNTVTLANSILAGNGKTDCDGSIASADYNLIGTTTGCSFTAAPHDLLNIAPGLGPLADRGGPTRTMALVPGSPAVDAANPAGCLAPNGLVLRVDQRGFPRSRPADPRCDIGAFELKQ